MPVAQIDGRTIAYTQFGPTQGVPVLLIHGFPLRGAMWDEVARVLGDVLAYRVIVPDLRGVGESAAAGPMAITVEENAHDVLGLADHLGIDRFVLGGLSMGGYIAFALLRQAQGRVVGLILADTRAGADSDAGKARREDLATRVMVDGPAAAVGAMVPTFFAPTAYQQRQDLVDRATAMIHSIAPSTIAGLARGLALRPDSTDLLATITSPTLILCGSEDSLTPPAEAEAMRARIPNARLIMIPNAGHISNWEDPVAFTAAVAGFLESLR